MWRLYESWYVELSISIEILNKIVYVIFMWYFFLLDFILGLYEENIYKWNIL